MSSSLAILDALPSIVDFYAHYWNKRPFLVRDAIDPAVMAGLIAPDELAGLSMEDTVRARLVSRTDWACKFGPFAEDDFNTADDSTDSDEEEFDVLDDPSSESSDSDFHN